jgi:transcriptional regulator with XRE-family HTH domain
MKTFGQVITEARKKAGLTQKEVAERLRREDGRKVLPPYLNDLEHDRRYPPENSVIDQLAKILGISADSAAPISRFSSANDSSSALHRLSICRLMSKTAKPTQTTIQKNKPPNSFIGFSFGSTESRRFLTYLDVPAKFLR